MTTSIRMLPPSGRPDPERLVPLVKEHVKQSAGATHDDRDRSRSGAAIVYLSDAMRERAEEALNRGDSLG